MYYDVRCLQIGFHITDYIFHITDYIFHITDYRLHILLLLRIQLENRISVHALS